MASRTALFASAGPVDPKGSQDLPYDPVPVSCVTSGVAQNARGDLLAQCVWIRGTGIAAGAAGPQLHPDQIEYALERVQLFWAACARELRHRDLPTPIRRES